MFLYMDQASCAGDHISFSLSNSHRSCCLRIIYHTNIFLVYFYYSDSYLKPKQNLKKPKTKQIQIHTEI